MPRRPKHPSRPGSKPRKARRLRRPVPASAASAASASPRPDPSAAPDVKVSPAVGAIPSGGEAPPTPGEPGQLDDAVAAIRQAQAEAAGGVVAAERAAQAGDARLLSAADQLADGQLTVLQSLTAEEIGDVFVMCFGWVADQRQAQRLPYEHWELSPKSALRLGKWVKRSIEIHGFAWVEKWLPDVLVVLFLAYEVQARRRLDQAYKLERAASEPKKP